MNKIFIPSLISLFLILGVGIFFNTNKSTTILAEAQNEENKERENWWNNMLIDPATGEIPIGVRSKEIHFLNYIQATSLNKKTRSATWENRGPWNVGGRTRAIAIDVKDEKHIIAGAVSGGIWQSFDGAVTWTRVSGLNEHPGCVSISQDTRLGKENIWYAVSGELAGTSASGGGAFYLGDGAFKSIDNGTTWKAITSTSGGVPSTFSINFQGAWRITASPVDSIAACIYMATYGSIYRSKDSGNTWTPVVGAGNDSYYTDVAVTSKGKVYTTLSSDGSTARGIYRSDDGVNFTNIVPAFLKSWDRLVIGINPNNENEVYFLGHLPSDTSGGAVTYNYENTPEYVCLLKYTYDANNTSVYKGTWENLSSNLPLDATSSFDKFNCQGGYDLFVKVQPGTNHVFVGGTNIYRSTDGFKTRNTTTEIGGYGVGTVLPFFTVYPNHHPDQHDVLFLKSNPNIMYSASDGGVRRTMNCNATNVTWENMNMGYVTSQLYSVTIDEAISKDNWVLGGFQDNGNFITPTNNKTHEWQMPVNGDGAINYIAPNKKYCLMSIQLGRIVKVELDAVGNLVARRRIDPAGFTKNDYGFINPLCVDASKDALYIPLTKRMGRLNNLNAVAVNNDYNQLADAWHIFTDTITTAKNGTRESEITAIECTRNNEDRVYIGTNNKELFRIDNASTSNKLIKLKVPTGIAAGAYVSDIAIDPDSSKNVMICYSNYNVQSIFYSRDTGNTWLYAGGNLEGNINSSMANPSIRTVAILKLSNGNRKYYAGTSIGLFSTDSLKPAVLLSSSKTVWQQESIDGIGAAVVTDIKVRQQDGYVAVATHGNGIFDSYVTGNVKNNGAVYSSLSDLYPNPVRNNLTYTFSVAQEDDMIVDVYNMMGQKVIQPFKKKYLAGTFTYNLNTANFATGHYLLSIRSEKNKAQVKQFTVIR
jgi:photosystem II stability/assembly factor-like uncharacterized protein